MARVQYIKGQKCIPQLIIQFGYYYLNVLILISFAGKGCGIQWAQDNVWIVYLAMYFRNVQLLIAFTG